ncbi:MULTISPECIES: hypothetical protein [unclassified Mucilaginibacter]|uniref:hypothetical protein n=1 Tax=unclassified Mucilaginibacter TaxID=2617802 RepID=UPI0031F6B85F
MEFQPGDAVNTPKGHGYINEVIDDEIFVDLTDGDHKREIFSKEEISLLPE